MSTAAIEYRQGTASVDDIHAHLAACSARHRPALAPRIDLPEYAQKIFRNAVTFEAWAGGALVGLVAAYLNDTAGRTGYVTNVSVTAEHAGRGVASRLMQACVARAAATGMRSLALEVGTANAAAIALYRKLGFAVSGDNGDFTTMRLSLGGNGMERSAMRDFNQEYKDASDRNYAYDFDWVVRKYLLKAIAPYFKPGARALELGCYKGDMTEQILGYFGHLTVVEGASELCELVAKRFPGKVDVIHSAFEAVRIDRGFDVVFLVHTLEHLDDPIGMLSRIKGWLAPGGRLFVAVPNANALSRQIAVRMGLITHNSAVTPAEKEHGHRITYSMDVLLSHLRAAGLKVVQEGGVLVKPLANFQFDKALAAGIVDEKYLDGCFELGKLHPDLCASLFAVCEG